MSPETRKGKGMIPVASCQHPKPKTRHHDADTNVFLVISRDVMDDDAPDHNPVKIGTETDYIQVYLCDRHDPGDGDRDALVPDGWELLEDQSERLPGR
jgi:hypothetical protein